MATKAGGSGAAGRRRTKDQAMASMMKRMGIERTTAASAVCVVVGVDGAGFVTIIATTTAITIMKN